MATIRIPYTNLCIASTVTITASSEISTRPDDYLANPARWKKWRSSTSTGDQNVVFDFGSSQTIKAVVLVDWKRHSGGAIKAEYWNGAAWVTFGTYTIPSNNPTKVLAAWNTSGVSTTKIRIYFTNTAVSNDYVELGVVFAGTYFQPTYGITDGFDLHPVDPSEIIAADGGQEQARTVRKYYVFDGQFETMPEADLKSFQVLYDTVGRTTPVVIAIDPDDNDEILYCRLTSEMPSDQVFTDNWNIHLSAQEAR